jgi:cobalt-zinc-cadmium efflux system outer membrane protein
MDTHVCVLRWMVIVSVLALPSSSSAQAPAPTRLTIDDAVALAARQNPTLRAKGLELRTVQANEITAGLRPNPQASYTADQIGPQSQSVQHSVTVGQTIETGGKRDRRIASAQAASRVTGYEVDDVRRQITGQVKKAFTDVLVAEATLALAQEST